jgi:hypothetical protein
MTAINPATKTKIIIMPAANHCGETVEKNPSEEELDERGLY